MRRLHYEEIAWLSISDRNRFDLAYGARKSRDYEAGKNSSRSTQLQYVLPESGATSYLENKQLAATRDQLHDNQLLDALVVASFELDDNSTIFDNASVRSEQGSHGVTVSSTSVLELTGVAMSTPSVPVAAKKRSVEQVRRRRDLMRRIISEFKNRPTKISTSMALTGPGRGPPRKKAVLEVAQAIRNTKQVTSQQLATVKLRKTGYQSGQFIGAPLATSSPIKEDKVEMMCPSSTISRDSIRVATPNAKYKSMSILPQPTPSKQLLKKIEKIQS